jgi:hypothetical protein
MAVRTLRHGVRSWSGLSVDHALLFGPAQSVSLVFERLPGAQLSIEQDDDSDALRVRYQPRHHDVLAALQAREGARAVVDFERGH